MILDDRKKKILQAIVEDYVSTGEPVGSRTVAKKYDLGMSPATIRNDMADLEEMGLLQQPHTSAGRVPSDLGYREYVDKIMKKQSLSREDINNINLKLNETIKEINYLIKQVSNVISQVTRYTSVAITPQLKERTIKHLQFVPVDKTKILLVLVTNDGIIKNFVIKVNKEYNADILYTVSNMLTEKFTGFSLENINDRFIKEVIDSGLLENDILTAIFETLRQNVYSQTSAEVFLQGTSNIFNFPEFSNIDKAREFLEALDEKSFLVNLLGRVNDEKINITIGSENIYNEIRGCSLISTSYWIGNRHIGTIGVIGPTRMDYAKVISCVEYLRNKLMHLINNFND